MKVQIKSFKESKVTGDKSADESYAQSLYSAYFDAATTNAPQDVIDRYKKEYDDFTKEMREYYGVEEVTEDTVKTKSGKWVNKGKEGTHGEFDTKKQADAQRRAMYANGFKG